MNFAAFSSPGFVEANQEGPTFVSERRGPASLNLHDAKLAGVPLTSDAMPYESQVMGSAGGPVRGRALRVVVGGGGTAGHIYPALAVAEVLRREDAVQRPRADQLPEETTSARANGGNAALFLHGSSRIDTEVFAHAGVAHQSLSMSQLRGVSAPRLALGGVRLLRAVTQASRAMGAFRPDACLVTGGYVSAPVVIAARLRRTPIVVFLPDVVPGMAIKTLAPLAERIAVAFPNTRDHWKHPRLVVTGYPVRPDFHNASRQRGREAFKIATGRNVVMVMGGSSGARSINFAIADVLEPLLHHSDVIHLCGEPDEPRLRSIRSGLGEQLRTRYHLFKYLHRGIADALAASDIVVCRAGASTLAELPMIGVPSILVPGSFAGGHQVHNATVLTEHGAAITIADDALIGSSPSDPSALWPTIQSLLQDPSRLQSMRAASQRLARPEAADNIVSLLRSVAGKSG
ncbi:MAG: UDP-N-acetylglucosamine--N-acetylmuramyl-(pentapeptide) pyrophosphoryl-undecaprenol N-acetylglucosamine transferase [Chloroflexi bacterium]|nr:UDP-N-acetylglucosamine--N-acetylmuramyl-(pentapeptide) pyrophosphoryl-undecaprenol N-acetylglucosamine transferase [Chloroflexota bacterium]